MQFVTKYAVLRVHSQENGGYIIATAAAAAGRACGLRARHVDATNLVDHAWPRSTLCHRWSSIVSPVDVSKSMGIGPKAIKNHRTFHFFTML